jgi:hypothetical protein
MVRFFITVTSARPEMLIDHDKGVGGSDLVPPVREAQPVVSHVETLGSDETSSSACCCIPSGVFRTTTTMRNIGPSRRNVSDRSTQTGQGGSSQAEAQIRAYFSAIAETSLA